MRPAPLIPRVLGVRRVRPSPTPARGRTCFPRRARCGGGRSGGWARGGRLRAPGRPRRWVPGRRLLSEARKGEGPSGRPGRCVCRPWLLPARRAPQRTRTPSARAFGRPTGSMLPGAMKGLSLALLAALLCSAPGEFGAARPGGGGRFPARESQTVGPPASSHPRQTSFTPTAAPGPLWPQPGPHPRGPRWCPALPARGSLPAPGAQGAPPWALHRCPRVQRIWAPPLTEPRHSQSPPQLPIKSCLVLGNLEPTGLWGRRGCGRGGVRRRAPWV